MKLIVGLGNPGREYERTRHNIGFNIIDEYLSSKGILNFKEKFQGLYSELNFKGEKIIFLKPQKYMNLSGEVVKKYMDFFKINLDDILIIHDDLDTPCGSIKLRLTGGSGGHNGLKNIESNINSKDYKRIKIGISNDKKIDTKDYVLGKFDNEELEKINKAIKKSVDIIDDYLILDFDKLMNKYNGKWYESIFFVVKGGKKWNYLIVLKQKKYVD